MKLNDKSQQKLFEVHEDLASVIYRAAEIGDIEFIVTEGLRTVEKQKQLVAKGASQTMRSRHLTGHAVDLAVIIDGEARWDWPLYHNLADIVKEAAYIEHIPIEWGGDWLKFKDGPHYQLPHSKYP